MSKLSAWFKTWRWYIVAYVAFVTLFWFVGKPHDMKPLTAYLAVNALNLVYAGAVWVVRIVRRG